MSDVQLPEISAEAKQMAMIAHIGSCVGFWVPLIVLLVKGNDQPYIKYHAMQAIVVSLVVGIAVGASLGFCALALPFAWILQVYVGLQANKGSWAGYPAIGGIGRPPEAIV